MKGSLFFTEDFLNFGSAKAVGKTLKRDPLLGE
jgi:hypothetical protein